MEKRFTNENFERFLRQNAEGLRMRPSDKVWKGISRRMNRSRRNFGFILSASLLTISTLVYYRMDHHAPAAASPNSAALKQIVTNKFTETSKANSQSTTFTDNVIKHPRTK